MSRTCSSDRCDELPIIGKSSWKEGELIKGSYIRKESAWSKESYIIPLEFIEWTVKQNFEPPILLIDALNIKYKNSDNNIVKKKKGKATSEKSQAAMRNFIDDLQKKAGEKHLKCNIKEMMLATDKTYICQLIKKHCIHFQNNAISTIYDYLQHIITYPTGNRKKALKEDFWNRIFHNWGDNTK